MEKIAVEFGPTSQISLRVTSLKSILATRLAPRILLPALTKCYSEVANTRKVRNLLFFCIMIKKKERKKKEVVQNFNSTIPAVSAPSLLATTSLLAGAYE